MSLESNKTLGGVGAILAAIPGVSIIGIILILIALKGLSENYNQQDIFKNALYGVIFCIIAGVAAVVVMSGSFLLGGITAPAFGPGSALFFAGGIIIGVVVLFIFYLLGTIFFKKSFDILSVKSGEKMFSTAGLLLLVGAILTIILVGFAVMFVAWILAAVAFFSIKTPAQPPSQPPTT